MIVKIEKIGSVGKLTAFIKSYPDGEKKFEDIFGLPPDDYFVGKAWESLKARLKNVYKSDLISLRKAKLEVLAFFLESQPELFNLRIKNEIEVFRIYTE